MMREFVLTGKTGTELGPQPPNLIRYRRTADHPALPNTVPPHTKRRICLPAGCSPGRPTLMMGRHQ